MFFNVLKFFFGTFFYIYEIRRRAEDGKNNIYLSYEIHAYLSTI